MHRTGFTPGCEPHFLSLVLSASAISLHADSQRQVLLLLGDFTCAHNVHCHPDADGTPICISGQVPPESSSAPDLCGHIIHPILPGCPQTVLNPECFRLKLILSPSQTSSSHWVSPSGADITVPPSSQPKSVASTPPSPSLSINKSVSGCERNPFLFAWVTAVAPQWSPSSRSLVNLLSHRRCTDQFSASNGFPSPAGSSSNSDACRAHLS